MGVLLLYIWENMGAGLRRQDPVLYSVPCLVTASLCGNCDKHGGPESRLKYEAVKQSHVGTSRAISNHHKPPSPSSTGEAPCGAHVFEGFFGLENGPVKSDKSQEKTLFGKEMPEDASRHPKPTSYPQTVVGVFPMESSN